MNDDPLTVDDLFPEPRPAPERLPPVLDACCGPRMCWFDPRDGRALFVDRRREVHHVDIGTPGTVGRRPIVVDPDVLADFRRLPFADDEFALVLFDPPHIERAEARGLFTRKYGHLSGDWRGMLQQGFAECFRVLKPHGVLVFKWAESDHPVAEILALTPHRPLFGHRSGRKMGTHWITFLKPAAAAPAGRPTP
jgi:SAM-dependent methyltransferase